MQPRCPRWPRQLRPRLFYSDCRLIARAGNRHLGGENKQRACQSYLCRHVAIRSREVRVPACAEIALVGHGDGLEEWRGRGGVGAGGAVLTRLQAVGDVNSAAPPSHTCVHAALNVFTCHRKVVLKRSPCSAHVSPWTCTPNTRTLRPQQPSFSSSFTSELLLLWHAHAHSMGASKSLKPALNYFIFFIFSRTIFVAISVFATTSNTLHITVILRHQLYKLFVGAFKVSLITNQTSLWNLITKGLYLNLKSLVLLSYSESHLSEFMSFEFLSLKFLKS